MIALAGPRKEEAEAALAKEAAEEDAKELERHPPPLETAVVVPPVPIKKKTVGAPGSRPFGDCYEGSGARPCSHYAGKHTHLS